MKQTLYIIVCLVMVACNPRQEDNQSNFKTICNPININYRYLSENPSRREAGDPYIVLYKGDYYLFSSFAGGYWWSNDLIDWHFINTKGIIEPMASTAVVINNTLYYLASHPKGDKPIFKAIDPKSGNWIISDSLDLEDRLWDPDFFLDDDGRFYLYWGCSDNTEPVYGIEIDYKDGFKSIGKPVELFWGHPLKHGWEQKGENNEDTIKAPWIEGPNMTKHAGLYYLQYAAPGTELTTYSDGVYVSDKPLGPYKYQKHNPFSYKPGGFIRGSGHSCTFKDKYGNYWHISTQILSYWKMTERRLGIHPLFFDKDSLMHTSTRFGDYPMIIPNRKIDKPEEILTGWMLLSYNKKVEASSTLDSFTTANITDENIKTFWVANTGNAGEWIILDLGKEYSVNAIQLNYFDYKTGVTNRDSNTVYIQYLLETSNDKQNWKILADKRENKNDIPHDYVQLDRPQRFRYLRLVNHHIPGGHFAISDIRVFGKGNDNRPKNVKNFKVIRNKQDRRMVTLSWEKAKNANGYNILFGVAKDKLYSTVQVDTVNIRVLRSLNIAQSYYFAIEAFNEGGISERSQITHVK